jgi:hypothetical protein
MEKPRKKKTSAFTYFGLADERRTQLVEEVLSARSV